MASLFSCSRIAAPRGQANLLQELTVAFAAGICFELFFVGSTQQSQALKEDLVTLEHFAQ